MTLVVAASNAELYELTKEGRFRMLVLNHYAKIPAQRVSLPNTIHTYQGWELIQKAVSPWPGEFLGVVAAAQKQSADGTSAREFEEYFKKNWDAFRNNVASFLIEAKIKSGELFGDALDLARENPEQVLSGIFAVTATVQAQKLFMKFINGTKRWRDFNLYHYSVKTLFHVVVGKQNLEAIFGGKAMSLLMFAMFYGLGEYARKYPMEFMLNVLKLAGIAKQYFNHGMSSLFDIILELACVSVRGFHNPLSHNKEELGDNPNDLFKLPFFQRDLSFYDAIKKPIIAGVNKKFFTMLGLGWDEKKYEPTDHYVDRMKMQIADVQ
jgi:hypothetical protein